LKILNLNNQHSDRKSINLSLIGINSVVIHKNLKADGEGWGFENFIARLKIV